MSSEENLGAGIALDESFDIEVGEQGDIDSVDGVEELNKDLAFALTIALDEFVGQPLNNELKSQIKNLTIQTINADSRVQFVRESEMKIRQSGRNTVAVLAPYNTSDGREELIFNIER